MSYVQNLKKTEKSFVAFHFYISSEVYQKRYDYNSQKNFRNMIFIFIAQFRGYFQILIYIAFFFSHEMFSMRERNKILQSKFIKMFLQTLFQQFFV